MTSAGEERADAVASLVERFRLVAIEWGDFRKPARVRNKLAKELWRIGSQLKTTRSGRAGIEELLSDPSSSVRTKAAARSLEWNPQSALQVLEEVAAGRGPDYLLNPGFAVILLDMYRSGEINADNDAVD
jgi:hypothetical protein